MAPPEVVSTTPLRVHEVSPPADVVRKSPQVNAPRRVQLSRARGWRMPANTLKVDRTSRWGNPFTVTQYYDSGYSGSLAVAQQHCVEAFRALLEGRTHWAHGIPPRHPVPDLAPLRGKDLACWCKAGTPCHADVLLQLANEER